VVKTGNLLAGIAGVPRAKALKARAAVNVVHVIQFALRAYGGRDARDPKQALSLTITDCATKLNYIKTMTFPNKLSQMR
jgi:hypothetical protein